jgi:hypothetical protein
MRRAHAILLALAAMLAACTPMQWVKQDATPEQLDSDVSECQQQAWREARYRAFWYRPGIPYIIQDPLGRRVFISPPGPFYDPFGDQFMEESRLANFCMRSKGYELQEVPKKSGSEP